MYKGMGRRNVKMMSTASQKDLRGNKQVILRGTTTTTTTTKNWGMMEKVIMMNSERKTMGDYEDSCWLDKEFELHFRSNEKTSRGL